MGTDKLSAVVRIKSSRIYEDVVLQIKDLVARGILLPGEKLPPERELAERFGIGRNSIREAIRQLELLGIVEARQGEGTFVTEATVDTIAAPFSSILMRSTTLRSEVLDFRKLIEPQIAAWAARRATAANIAKIEALVVRFDRCVTTPRIPVSEAIEIDSQFHYAIAEASQNGLVVRVVNAVMDLIHEFREQLLDASYRTTDTAGAHRAVFEAIRDGDSRRAQQAMEDHLDQLESYMAPDHA